MKYNMLIIRVITGVVGAILICIVLFFGGKLVFFVLLLVVAFMAIGEYLRIANLDLGRIVQVVGAFVVGMTVMGNLELVYLLYMLSIVYLWVTRLFQRLDYKEMLVDLSLETFGYSYLVLFLSSIGFLAASEYGILWVGYLLSSVWGSDAMAFLIGRFFGRRPLTAVSPSKTWEGCFGGIVAAVLVSVLFFKVFMGFLDINKYTVVMLGVCMAILGILGDLFESFIKRAFGTKDSGRILPGHGGILDRLDSLLFSAPVLFGFRIYVIGK